MISVFFLLVNNFKNFFFEIRSFLDIFKEFILFYSNKHAEIFFYFYIFIQEYS